LLPPFLFWRRRLTSRPVRGPPESRLDFGPEPIWSGASSTVSKGFSGRPHLKDLFPTVLSQRSPDGSPNVGTDAGPRSKGPTLGPKSATVPLGKVDHSVSSRAVAERRQEGPTAEGPLRKGRSREEPRRSLERGPKLEIFGPSTREGAAPSRRI